MTKTEKFECFAEFVIKWIIIPLVVAFVVTLIPLSGVLLTGAEWMWSVWLAYACYIIAGIWFILFVVAMIGTAIIGRIEDKRYEEQEILCNNCDCRISEDFTDCDSCVDGSNFSNILIEKDESEG